MTVPSLPHFVFFSTISIILVTGNTQCLHEQKTLLLQLKSELEFNPFLQETLIWNEPDCCHWNGVECDGVGRVIGLHLDHKAIIGSLNDSSSLFHLRYLEKLNLAHNDFTAGTHIPRKVGNLTNLEHLDLSYAGFEGQIPVELSFLRRLITLDLSTSTLSLKLEYPSFKMMIQNLTRLTSLNLDGVDISSANGSDWGQVISSSLPHLSILSLRDCNLSGPFPPSLSQLHSLSVLQFDGNNLSSSVPDFLANLSSLATLTLSHCFLRGYFPDMIFQVPTLQKLDLSFNDLLNGTIPKFSLSRAFRSIDISHCNFFGSIPSMLSNLTDITHLDLSFNNLMGSLTNSHFENFLNLTYLSLAHNSLRGNIPNSIFGLPSLEFLDLSNNKFSGQINKFSIANNSNIRGRGLYYFNDDVIYNNVSVPLKILDLSNNQITGVIPSWVWEITDSSLNLSCNLFESLQKPYHINSSPARVDLHSNQLTGELPPIPKRADYVDYSNNKFGSLIPPTLFANVTQSLSFLSLANNSLSGAIPTSTFEANFLSVLDLSFNKLRSDIPPSIINMEFLQVLNLRGNYIYGSIPDKFHVRSRLTSLDLSKNNLSGKIPKSIANCKSLEVMNVGHNNFDHSFPCMLPSSLRVLVLRSNRFHGEMRCDKSWPSLQIVDISSNNFNGTLHPLNFSNWRGMMLEGDTHEMLNHSGSDYVTANWDYPYQVEVTMTVKGINVNLVKIWPYFTSIDFSCNKFQGDIPDAIGNLRSLYLLNLSHNAFTGAIPIPFGDLTELESLDVSFNQLRRRIPEELAQLSFLSVLNVSFNDLVGMIPSGRQFQTFPADSFEGNPSLCGFPLNRSCRRTHETGSTTPNQKDEEIEWEYVCAALGYVVGLGSIVWLLLFCRSFRERYFEKIEEVFVNTFEPRRRHGRRVVRRNEARRRQ